MTTPRKKFDDRVLEEVRPGLEVFKVAFGSIGDFTPENMPGIRAHLDPIFEAGREAAPRFDDIEMF